MDILWKINRKIRKILIANSPNPRPSSYPYVSGDGFRSLADHIYESGKENPSGKGRSFNPVEVRKDDVVFVETYLLEEYFSQLHPHIQHPYKLITHNSDRNITERELAFIDDKIIRWFAQNVIASHEKITPIPIGLENQYYYNFGVPRIFDGATRKPGLKTSGKKNRIMFGFNIKSNEQERRPAFYALSGSPLALEIKDWPHPSSYLSSVASYRFIASPPGNGTDCHRTWEAMLVGTVPIVKRSICMEYFKKLGLPIMIIDSWDELSKMTGSNLASLYDFTMKGLKKELLYMGFWRDLIYSKK